MQDDDYPYEPERDYQRGEASATEPEYLPKFIRNSQQESSDPESPGPGLRDPGPREKMGFETAAAQAAVTLGDDLWDLHATTARLLQFTAGRSQAEFAESDLLQAATDSLLRLAQAAAARIQADAPAIAARLERVAALQTALSDNPQQPPVQRLWLYVHDDLQALHASAAAELETWHSG